MQRHPHTPTVVCIAMLVGGLVLWKAPVLAVNGDAFSGHKLFQAYCLPCHGLGGKGDGVGAGMLQTTPRDLTDDTFMSSRTDAQLETAIGQRTGPHGALAMPDWRGIFTAQDIADIVAYIRTLHRQPSVTGVPAQGAQLFTRYCWTCHGPAGKGNGEFTIFYKAQPHDWSDQATMASRTDAEVYTIISQGGAAVGRAATMPAWGHLLTPQDIRDLVAYIRHLAR